MARDKQELRARRKSRIRKKGSGTAKKPRMSVFRSASRVYVQLIDDANNHVLASASSLGKAVADEVAGLNKSQKAENVGTRIATLCKQKGIERVFFDRNGYQYHGRVRALAGAAREAGLQF